MGWEMAREMVRGREIFSGFLLNFSEEVGVWMRGCAIMHLSPFNSTLAFCLLSSWDQLTGSFPPSQSVYIVSGFQGHLCTEKGWKTFLFLNWEETCSLLRWPGTHTILSDPLPVHQSLFFCCLCERSRITRQYRVWFHGGREDGTCS